jgi:hypothetical protein
MALGVQSCEQMLLGGIRDAQNIKKSHENKTNLVTSGPNIIKLFMAVIYEFYVLRLSVCH